MTIKPAVETRPSRLLGPAVSLFVTLARGVCPFHGVWLRECPGGLGLLDAMPLDLSKPWQSPDARDRRRRAREIRTEDERAALYLSDLHYGVSMAGAR